MDHDQTVKVTIHGVDYPIAGHDDIEYIQKVARYVDDQIGELERQTSITSPLRLAVLTAMNIAGEYFALKEEKEQLLGEFEDKAREISEYLNQELEKSSS